MHITGIDKNDSHLGTNSSFLKNITVQYENRYLIYIIVGLTGQVLARQVSGMFIINGGAILLIISGATYMKLKFLYPDEMKNLYE